MSYVTTENGIGCRLRMSEMPVTGDIQVETVDIGFTYKCLLGRTAWWLRTWALEYTGWVQNSNSTFMVCTHTFFSNTRPLTHMHPPTHTPTFSFLNSCLLLTLVRP